MPVWFAWVAGSALVSVIAGEGIRRAGAGVEDVGQGLVLAVGAGVVAGVAAPLIVKGLRK